MAPLQRFRTVAQGIGLLFARYRIFNGEEKNSPQQIAKIIWMTSGSLTFIFFVEKFILRLLPEYYSSSGLKRNAKSPFYF